MLVDLWRGKVNEVNGNILMIFNVSEFSAKDLAICFFPSGNLGDFVCLFWLRRVLYFEV